MAAPDMDDPEMRVLLELWGLMIPTAYFLSPTLLGVVSLKQVIRELEESQKPVNSPMILNGSPFGFFANHSLVMANYVSRANAAIIDLKSLLDRG